ncbi:DeoR/GlpR family DNA-binding transcription regulator [Pelosinus propionicus]|uniref:Transcriptional regulator, DeoR family n=1 Tax=Pelosinus propionicus DSM 13327 TaxID=1123291 RepID=A0A1I4L5X3_9FIRM|nr:DeoR/GlpR family DNA-binding transcription regulator [Pelosinus propionicus]SFL86266.1 transcriptional regulator, DeoR family [Pelosinus propionicus DSM 13327]
MKINRISEIEKYTRQLEHVSLDRLCDVFKVSKNTIRRDISELAKRGAIKKVYGGITINQKNGVESREPFESREIKYQVEKSQIAKLASDLVDDDDVIFIDSGTTTIHMIPFLANKQNITIVTTNLHAITASIPYPNLNVISTGGVLYRGTNSLTGTGVTASLRNYNIKKAFLASTGVSLTKGVTNISPLETEIKRYLIENSTQTALLVDHTKINIASLMTYGNLEDFNYFITNTLPPAEFVDFFAANNIALLTP